MYISDYKFTGLSRASPDTLLPWQSVELLVAACNSLKTMNIAVNETPAGKCIHCGLPLPTGPLNNFDSKLFCCRGCQFAYKLINDLGLSDFYRLKEKTPPENPLPAESINDSFSWLDKEPHFSNLVNKHSENSCYLHFQVSGIHCPACIWLLERLPMVKDGIIKSEVNFGRHEIRINFNPAIISASQVASLVNSLGYRPLFAVNAGENQIKTLRDLLLRLGVAGLAAGNTMLIAVSLYQGDWSGIESKYSNFLRYVSLLLSIPALFYSAVPFFRGAAAAIRTVKPNLDLPISIGLVSAFLLSSVNTLRGYGHVYFDSLCMLIFLLLAGRVLTEKSIARAKTDLNYLEIYLPREAVRVVSGVEQRVPVQSLSSGDTVKIESGEIIPADAVVLEGRSYVDNSILSGESQPIAVKEGDNIFAGCKNVANTLLARVTSAYRASRFGKIVAALEEAGLKKSAFVKLTDKLSTYFVLTVIALAVLTFIIWSASGIDIALEHTLALLVVSCPCALGLSAPLAISVAAAQAAKRGLLFRREDIIERLAKIKTVFFDKTGTLTEGLTRVNSIYIFSENGDPGAVNPEEFKRSQALQKLAAVIAALEKNSTHPVGRALWGFFAPVAQESAVADNPSEKPGLGVSARINENLWFVGSPLYLNQPHSVSLSNVISKITAKGLSPVLLACNKEPVMFIGVGDILRPGVEDLIAGLKRSGRKVKVISGDNCETVKKVAAQLNIPAEDAIGELSPEDKQREIEALKSEGLTAMVGDGLNDLVALKTADVGIGVRGGAENCLRNADVFLKIPSAENILLLFKAADRTLRVIKRNLLFSFIYNVSAAALAISGLIGPLAAAIIMPLSSLTVIVSSGWSRPFRNRI
ncbi:MAG: heavy metal translocating P-type ATPase [Candidatus Dadabacteria bacterium]|nr:MAG: heavy metal translocating P-type ATPase [Candidatus Dadabacteria bacterium]